MSIGSEEYWDESIYAEVEREARDTWRQERPDLDLPGPEEL